MNGRGRINKGSKNFINFVNSSKEIYKFYKDFNNLQFFKKFFFLNYNLIINQKKNGI